MWPFKPRKPLQNVGQVKFSTDLTEDGKTVRTVHHYAILFMSEDNERAVKYATGDTSDYHLKRHGYYALVENWKNGGKFPQGCDYEEPLGEMLNRMIDAKLTGKK